MLIRAFGSKGVDLVPDRKMNLLPVPHRAKAAKALRVLENINHFEDEQSRECIDILRRFIDSR